MRPLQTVFCCVLFTALSAALENVNNPQISEDEIENHRNIHLLPTECGNISEDRIVNGTSAGLYEFPWLALVSYRTPRAESFRCGGTVISELYVLTAAQCIVHQHITGVRIGDYDISQPNYCVGEGETRECEHKHQDIEVTLAIPHPGFDGIRYPIDIGLLRLARPVDFSHRNVGAICLPLVRYHNIREKDLAGEVSVVVGWNLFQRKNNASTVLKEKTPLLSKTECTSLMNSTSRLGRIYANILNLICTRDTCSVDAGGPLMLETQNNDTNKFVQIGICSLGIKGKSCDSKKPLFYTDVRKFVKWILDTIEP